MIMQPEIEDVHLSLSVEQSRAFHRLTNPKYAEVTRVIYGGQAGGGKSFLICIWLDYMAETYPGTRYYLGRETLKEIKESVLLTFFDVKALTGSPARYSEGRSKIIYPNGSEIYLIETFEYPSDPNFDRLGSREYTAGAIEEGINVSKRAANLLISRTRYKHDVYGLTPKQLITCNPGDGWIKDEIVIPTLEGKIVPRNNVFIRATLDSNPNKAFAEAYTKTLDENLTAYDKARLLHGDWNARPKSGAEFLKEFSQDKHVGVAVYDPNLPLHVSFDENVHPYITCLVFQIQQEKDSPIRNVVQLDEICLPPPTNSRKHVCNEFVKRYEHHNAGLFIYGDATSWKSETSKEYGENFFTEIETYLRRYNPVLRVPGINPRVMSKGSFLNLILEKNYRHIRFLVDHQCKKSINDYAYALEDVNGEILKKRVQDPETGISYEKFGHHIDAMSYFVCEAFLPDYNYYLMGNKQPQYDYGTDRKERFYR